MKPIEIRCGASIVVEISIIDDIDLDWQKGSEIVIFQDEVSLYLKVKVYVYINSSIARSLKWLYIYYPIIIGAHSCTFTHVSAVGSFKLTMKFFHLSTRYPFLLPGEQRHTPSETLTHGVYSGAQPGIEPGSSRSKFQHCNQYTTASKLGNA